MRFVSPYYSSLPCETRGVNPDPFVFGASLLSSTLGSSWESCTYRLFDRLLFLPITYVPLCYWFLGLFALLLERLCGCEVWGASTDWRRSLAGLVQLLNDVLLCLCNRV